MTPNVATTFVPTLSIAFMLGPAILILGGYWGLALAVYAVMAILFLRRGRLNFLVTKCAWYRNSYLAGSAFCSFLAFLGLLGVFAPSTIGILVAIVWIAVFIFTDKKWQELHESNWTID